MSKAEKVVESYTSRKAQPSAADLKGLPADVQELIGRVVAASVDIDERVKLAEALWEEQPGHPLALEPGKHPQTSWAQAFVVVGNEMVEITKEGADQPVTLKLRPDLHASPALELAERLRAPEE